MSQNPETEVGDAVATPTVGPTANGANRIEGSVLTGTVKRYNSKNGYGFITADDGGEDLFVHQSEILTDGFRCLEEGGRIKCVFHIRQGKHTATRVEGEHGPLKHFPSRMAAAGGDVTKPVSLPPMPGSLTGRIKWFDTNKGFGFLLQDGKEDTDVFVHIKDCVNGMIPDENMQVYFTIETEADGRYRARNVNSPNAPTQPRIVHVPVPVPVPNYQSYQQTPPGFGQGGYNPYPNAQQFQPNYNSAPAGGGSNHLFTGTIKFYNPAKGFGFIITPMNTELYLGKTGLVNPEGEVNSGDVVQYTEESNGQKVWAVQVRVVSGAGGSGSRKRGPDDSGDLYQTNKAARSGYTQASAHGASPAISNRNFGKQPNQYGAAGQGYNNQPMYANGGANQVYAAYGGNGGAAQGYGAATNQGYGVAAGGQTYGAATQQYGRQASFGYNGQQNGVQPVQQSYNPYPAGYANQSQPAYP